METLLAILIATSKAEPDYTQCKELAPILKEAVEQGYLTNKGAYAILLRCYENADNVEAPILT